MEGQEEEEEEEKKKVTSRSTEELVLKNPGWYSIWRFYDKKPIC